MPCCGQTLNEAPQTDYMTLVPSHVNCRVVERERDRFRSAIEQHRAETAAANARRAHADAFEVIDARLWAALETRDPDLTYRGV